MIAPASALSLLLLPLLALDLLERMEQENNLRDLEAQEYYARGRAAVGETLSRSRPRIARVLFQITLAAGFWIGLIAQRPLFMIGCYLLAQVAIARALGTRRKNSLPGLLRTAGTLSAAAALGLAFRTLLR